MTYKEAMLAAGRAYFEGLATECRTRKQLAQCAGVNRTDLYKKLRKYGVRIHKRYYGNAAWRELGS